MPSFSFKKKFALIPLLLSLFISACGNKTESNLRKYIPLIDTSSSGLKMPHGSQEDFLAGDLFAPSMGMKACDWLDSLPTSDVVSERFRMLGAWQVSEALALPLTSVEGGVDIGASPLYQYALLTQQIPDKTEFLALLDQEYEKAVSFGDVFKIGAARKLIQWGFLNPYSLRNDIVQERMEEALPGAFLEKENPFLFLNSIPGAVFQNGNPFLVRLSISESDDEKTRKIKRERLVSAMTRYKRPVRLFSSRSWETYAKESKTGLSIAIRAMSSKDVTEQACATVIFHRNFAQLLSIMGYSRPSVVEPKNENLSFLASFPAMLVHPESNTFAVCPTPGSFSKAGKNVLLTREDLAGTVSQLVPFELSSEPFIPTPCDASARKAYDPLLGGVVDDSRIPRVATASELLAFLDGIVNFMTTFNPGAAWWRNPDNAIGFPLSPFESLEKIKSSGAILPADSHALSLGFLNLSFDLLLRRHLVFVDANNKVVSNSASAAGVRVSQTPYKANAKDFLRTHVSAAAHLAEIAFKLSHSLVNIGNWKAMAEMGLKEELRFEPDFRKRQAIMRDYRDFIEGMFGSEDNLSLLSMEGQGSLREQVKDLKLVSSLLALRFVKRNTGGKATCYQELVLDPITGEEKGVGQCSPTEEAAWKYALGLAARSFQSPLFLEVSE